MPSLQIYAGSDEQTENLTAQKIYAWLDEILVDRGGIQLFAKNEEQGFLTQYNKWRLHLFNAQQVTNSFVFLCFDATVLNTFFWL